jgi:hypothetical protein
MFSAAAAVWRIVGKSPYNPTAASRWRAGANAFAIGMAAAWAVDRLRLPRRLPIRRCEGASPLPLNGAGLGSLPLATPAASRS